VVQNLPARRRKTEKNKEIALATCTNNILTYYMKKKIITDWIQNHEKVSVLWFYAKALELNATIFRT
jgi:hypothetical protein